MGDLNRKRAARHAGTTGGTGRGGGVFRGQAHGLQIESDLPLPELMAADGPAEVRIRLGAIPRPADAPADERCITADEDQAHLFWPQAGSYVIRGGVEIRVDPVANAAERLVRIGLLGPALATLLQQRGRLVLHASAVNLDGNAIAFIGWKGQGKSTTAAALFARGFPLLTDDVLALEVGATGRPLAYPSFPQFKLWPDSVQGSLGDDPESLPTLLDNYDKRARSASSGFARGPAPLAAIYVLCGGETIAAHRLSAQDTFRQLVSNTFCARYGSRMFAGKVGTSHLRNCARVANAVPIYRLERPRSLPGLKLLTAFLIEHSRTH